MSCGRRRTGRGKGRRTKLGVREWLAVLACACLIAYSLTIGAIPGKITILEGTAKELRVGWPLQVTFHLTGEQLVRVDGAPGSPDERTRGYGAGVVLVPLGRGETSLEVRLLDLIPVRRLLVDVVPEVRVVPGGQAIGVLLSSRGVVVVGHYPVTGADGRRHYPAREAGLEVGDVIVSIGGRQVESRSDVERMIDLAARSGKPVELGVVRGQRNITVKVRPIATSDDDVPGAPRGAALVRYKVGIWVRENAAGVGTLSFYEPASRIYCALGHVITDVATNRDMDVSHGRIVQAHILGVHQGDHGQPGEKVGSFGGETDIIGTIERNTRFGIFGALATIPPNPHFPEAIPVALAEEVTCGPADLYTVVDDNRIEKFAVEIQKVARQSSPQVKGLVLKVVDQRLLALTGGIVQGMSGSPIVKDGKLVGVLTHVFVSDQTRGYGVLAEWLARDAGLFRTEEAGRSPLAGAPTLRDLKGDRGRRAA